MNSDDGAGAPPRELAELADLSWELQVLAAAAALGIPDCLAAGAMDAATLARAVNADGASVARLLRALQSLGVCRATAEGAFALTPAGEFLRVDKPNSLRGPILFSADMLWKQFGDLTNVVRSGQPSKAVTAGAAGFDALKNDPARLHAFQLSMVASSVPAAQEAARAHDFGRYKSVLDLGGGYGGVLAVLLQVFPRLTGAVCDLGYLAEGASQYLADEGVAARARFIPGNFFESVPGGFDCYVLKFIIHDWNDANAQTILTHCAAAARPHAKIVLIEKIVPDDIGQDAESRAIVRADMTMMTVGGKERTRAEYEALFHSAGLRLDGVTPLPGGFSLLEATPA